MPLLDTAAGTVDIAGMFTQLLSLVTALFNWALANPIMAVPLVGTIIGGVIFKFFHKSKKAVG